MNLKAISKFYRVPDFEIPESELSVVIRMVNAIAEVLSWASVEVAKNYLLTGESPENDGYNLSVGTVAIFKHHNLTEGDIVTGGIGWKIVGGCGYGSHIEIRDDDSVCFVSSGGHWVSASSGMYGSVTWQCDDLVSTTSWEDADQFPNGGAEAVASRIERLKKAYQEA